MRPLPLVLDKCPICEAPYSGGCASPGTRYPKVGLRVFYKCGCSVSVKEDLEAKRAEAMGRPDTHSDYIAYLMLVKNCNGGLRIYDEEAEVVDDGDVQADHRTEPEAPGVA